MRAWGAVPLLIVAFSGCIGVGSEVDEAHDLGPYERWEWAYGELVETYPATAGFVLHAIVGTEPLEVDEREDERRSSPTGTFLAGGDDPDRLDGRAKGWVYLFRDADGGGWADVLTIGDRVMGMGFMSPGAGHPVYDHFSGGAPLGAPVIGPVGAAEVARETGVLDGVVDDARWDLIVFLQQWTDNEGPVWVFEAKSRDNATRRSVGVDATTGAVVEVGDDPLQRWFAVPSYVGLPPEERAVEFSLANVGYDELAVAVEEEGFTLYAPDGASSGRSVNDPPAGTWRVVLDRSLAPIGAAVDVQVCVAEEPDFRSGSLVAVCER